MDGGRKEEPRIIAAERGGFDNSYGFLDCKSIENPGGTAFISAILLILAFILGYQNDMNMVTDA